MRTLRKSLALAALLIGSAHAETINYSSPAALFSNVYGLTSGSIVFGGSNGHEAQDNANLFWDDTNNELAIGTPSGRSNTFFSVTQNASGGFTSFLSNTNTGAGAYAEFDVRSGSHSVGMGVDSVAGGGDAYIFSDAPNGLALSSGGVLDFSSASSTTFTLPTSFTVYANTELKLQGGTGGVNVYTNGVYPINIGPNFSSSGGISSDPHVIRGGSGTSHTLSVFPDRVYINGIKSSLAPGNDTIGIYPDVDNDATGTATSVWGLYLQARARAGSANATGKLTMGMEISPINNNTSTTMEPFTLFTPKNIEGIRVSAGNNVDGTTDITNALSFLSNTQKFGSIIVVANGALRTDAGLTHPSIVAAPSGANGYAYTWYRQAGFTTPAWQIYSTSTTTDGNTLTLADAGATFNTALTATALTLSSTPLPVTSGGLGAATETAHGVLLGQGTSAVTATAVGATNTLLHGITGADPTYSAVVSADLNLTTTTCTNQFLTAISATGTGTCSTVTLAGAQFANQGTTTTVLHGNGAGNPSFGAIVNADITNSTIDLTAKVTGALPAANGGTGQSSYAVGDIPYASGSTAISKLADVAAGSYLRSGGVTTAPVWSTTTLPNSATTGDLLYASATSVYSNLADVAAGSFLRSGGTSTAPAWSTLVMPNAITSGGIFYGSATNTAASSGALTSNAMVKGGGAGGAPTSGQITDDGSTITLPGTTVNISATTLQRSGNTVLLGRRFTATYDPASLAAATAREDTVTVTGVTTAGGAVSVNLPVAVAAGCVIANIYVSAADTVKIDWQNTNTVAACDTASSTAVFTQAQ